MDIITEKLKGNWNQIKGKLKEKYGDLTDNDLIYEDGKEDQILGTIQEKVGTTKEELIDFIKSI